MGKLLTLLLALVGAMVAAGRYRTQRMQASPRAATFAAGLAPSPPPDGFHEGRVAGYTGRWQGKRFEAVRSRGINVFQEGPRREEKFPFQTWVGKGLQDPDLDVLKIDYDIPENPLWVRRILDEIVEVAPGEYLGKLHLRIVPGMPFTLGYFELRRGTAEQVAEGAATTAAG
jgi:hypothetical protein